jgi:hypothetical protein
MNHRDLHGVIIVYLTSSCVSWPFFGMSGPTSAKKGQFTQERVEYHVFLFDEPIKGSKSLKIFKISLTFRFDKLSNLSKSVHTGENSQILTVSNKKLYFVLMVFLLLISKLFFLQPSKKRDIYASLSSRKVCHFLIDQK